MARLHAVPRTAPRAIAYVRVSKERDEMISPELQETAIRDHCLRHGYEVVEVIADLDLSGRFWKRRQVERAVAMVEAGHAEVIVVWKISRVARNRLDWNIALDRVETIGGRLESATEPIDTSTSSGRFSRGILAELAAFESERAGEQWQETHRRSWRRGRPHSGKPRFGYTYDREQGFRPDPETAPLVAELYARYMGGEGLHKLADWLKSLGRTELTTGRGVAYFLRSGFAAGYLVHHDPACTLAHRPGKQCPNVVRETGAHEPIVTAELFAQFEALSVERATLPPRLVSPVSTMSGIVTCAACGHRMARKQPKASTGETPYFRCANRACPQPVSFREHKAETMLLEWLPTVRKLVDDRARALGGASTASVERDSLARVVTRAEEALGKLTVDYARGLIPDTAYTAAVTALQAERDDAARKHARLADATRDGAGMVAAAEGLLANWERMLPEQRNRIIRELVTIEVARVGNKPTGTPVPRWT